MPKCLKCGYDLQGLIEGRCPECGAFQDFMRQQMRQKAGCDRVAAGLLVSSLGWSASLVWAGLIWEWPSFVVSSVAASGCLIAYLFYTVRAIQPTHRSAGRSALLTITAWSPLALLLISKLLV